MEKTQISNPRFELISSSLKGYKEVQIIFDYQGINKKYFVFVKEGKNVNYINEAKKKFEEDINSGKVAKTLKRAGKVYIGRPWLIATTGVLGAAALALGGLFIWKALTKVTYTPGDPVEVTPEVIVPAGSTYSVNIGNTKAKVGEDYHTDITLGSSSMINEEECYLPDKPVSVISGTKALKDNEYKYTLSPSKLSATLDIEGKYIYGPIFVNLVVEAPGGEPTIPWYQDNDYLEALDIQDVGTIQKVEVNGINHRVRLIGIDQDEESTESTDNPRPEPIKYAHTTWEFADFICDKNGYSLATFWNDTTDNNYPCKDYLNSSIRYALMGDEVEYDSMPIHGWYEKDMGTRSKNYKDPVIKMLPTDLVKNIKPVKKKVVYYNGSTYMPITCEDKLFLLSSDEMVSHQDMYAISTGTPYMYYYDTRFGEEFLHDYNDRRIKRQIKVTEGARTSGIPITDSQQGALATDVESIAGYNSTNIVPELPGIIAGAGYWLRDIRSGFEQDESCGTPYGGSSNGEICDCNWSGHGGRGNFLATPIAPAFCL